MSLSHIFASRNNYDLSAGKDKSLPLKAALFASKNTTTVVNGESSNDNNFPCDSIHTCTTADDSSVSTIGSNVTIDGDSSYSRRCLFSDYWTKTGEKPIISSSRRRERSSTSSFAESNDLPLEVMSSSTLDDSEHSISEIAIEDHVGPMSPLNKQGGAYQRRPVFCSRTQRSYSVPCLSPNSPSKSIIRNAVSDVELAKSRAASCLRQPRFSGSRTKRRSSSSASDSSVHFSPSTEVVHFTAPLEVFAEENWTKHFH